MLSLKTRGCGFVYKTTRADSTHRRKEGIVFPQSKFMGINLGGTCKRYAKNMSYVYIKEKNRKKNIWKRI